MKYRIRFTNKDGYYSDNVSWGTVDKSQATVLDHKTARKLKRINYKCVIEEVKKGEQSP